MRYVAMQVLTWGTVVGAAGSALLLAAHGGAVSGEAAGMSLSDATRAVATQTEQGRTPQRVATRATSHDVDALQVGKY